MVGLVALTPFKVTVGLVPVTPQLSTELPPAATDGADAVKLVITGAVTEGEVDAVFTVTTRLLVAVPPGPAAVSVNVVDLDKVVEPEPLAAVNGPVCTPFDNVAEVAPCTV